AGRGVINHAPTSINCSAIGYRTRRWRRAVAAVGSEGRDYYVGAEAVQGYRGAQGKLGVAPADAFATHRYGGLATEQQADGRLYGSLILGYLFSDACQDRADIGCLSFDERRHYHGVESELRGSFRGGLYGYDVAGNDAVVDAREEWVARLGGLLDFAR